MDIEDRMSSEAALQLPKGLVEAHTTSDLQRLTVEHVASHALERGINLRSDEELLKAVENGSKDALGLLFRRHGRAVFNVAWRILRDESEAADLRQDVFLYLFERAQLYDPRKATALSWIVQVTYHRAIDRRRYLSFRQHYKLEALDEQRQGPTSAEVSTDQLDGKAILNKLRGQLTSDQQQTLELHFFEGYSFREIAEKSGQPIGNVRHPSAMSRCIAHSALWTSASMLRYAVLSRSRGDNVA
jgi:RNA polymerase sigma-70 factor, ECF subfamily